MEKEFLAQPAVGADAPGVKPLKTPGDDSTMGRRNLARDGVKADLKHPFEVLVIDEQRKKIPWLVGVVWGIILPSYMGIAISQYKDPYKPTSIMESRRVFFVAQMEMVLKVFPIPTRRIIPVASPPFINHEKG